VTSAAEPCLGAVEVRMSEQHELSKASNERPTPNGADRITDVGTRPLARTPPKILATSVPKGIPHRRELAEDEDRETAPRLENMFQGVTDLDRRCPKGVFLRAA